MQQWHGLREGDAARFRGICPAAWYVKSQKLVVRDTHQEGIAFYRIVAQP
jgi:hypothetical protein